MAEYRLEATEIVQQVVTIVGVDYDNMDPEARQDAIDTVNKYLQALCETVYFDGVDRGREDAYVER